MQHTSLKAFDAMDVASCATTVKMLLSSEVGAGKVVVVVEGDDDKMVYEKFFSSVTVLIYPDGNCDKHILILNALKFYKERVLAIKDADFDRLNGFSPVYDNLFITDTHDLEGMILQSDIFENLSPEDKARCVNVDVVRLKKELEDISYMKWHNNVNSLNLNFRNVSVAHSIDDYIDRVIKNSKVNVSYDVHRLHEFRKAHQNADLDELTNGHDLFEKIYIVAQRANKSNFPKKKFFKRLKNAYSFSGFNKTTLYKNLKLREPSFAQSLFK